MAMVIAMAWRAAAKQRVRIAEDDTWSDIFSKLLVEHVEPNLGQGRLTCCLNIRLRSGAGAYQGVRSARR